MTDISQALTRIEAELAAATPGPWNQDGPWYPPQGDDAYPLVTAGKSRIAVAAIVNESEGTDLTLIAHAPTYLAALVEVAKKAQLHLDYHHADDYHGELLRAALDALTKAVEG